MKPDRLSKRVVMGRFGAPHGVKGLVKVYSYTQPIENILHYQPWYFDLQGVAHVKRVQRGQVSGDHLLVAFEEIQNREAAYAFVNASIAVDRSVLPPLPEGQYYWTDLEGLTVKNEEGFIFGQLTSLMATGANDVMFIQGKKNYCLPYVMHRVVKEVDLLHGVMRVDWPEE